MKISFGMIFSLIIIIAIITTAFFVIRLVLKNQRCMEINLVIEDLKENIDQAWKSEKVSYDKEFSVPTQIKKICFINLNSRDGIPEEVYLEIRENSESDNLFLFPANSACERHATSLNHIEFDNFCIDNTGKISLRFEKSLDEDFVRIKNE